MKFHIITIFTESFESFISTSIIWKWIEKGLFSVKLYKLWDFSTKKFKHVDDKAYWMHGQVISPEPLSEAIEHIQSIISSPYEGEVPSEEWRGGWGKWNIPIIYMSPSGDLLTQEKVETYYNSFAWKELIIICGHYEWIDQRIIDLYVTHSISIWEYVMTSWELASQVLIDSIVRHIPWVIGNKQSLVEESFSQFFDRQKEHPVYTRPQEFKWLNVPEILTSGNHKEIEHWKQANTK